MSNSQPRPLDSLLDSVEALIASPKGSAEAKRHMAAAFSTATQILVTNGVATPDEVDVVAPTFLR